MFLGSQVLYLQCCRGWYTLNCQKLDVYCTETDNFVEALLRYQYKLILCLIKCVFIEYLADLSVFFVVICVRELQFPKPQ